MESYEPIPTPPAQRWREFRIRYVPVVVFFLGLAAAVTLWEQFVEPNNFKGVVEAVRANVTVPKAGTIVQLQVAPLQSVRAGDAIAQVVTTDPKILEATLAVIRARIGLLRAGMGALTDQQRNAVNYEQLRLSWLEQRAALATHKVQLELAQSELRRNQSLLQAQIISTNSLERFQNQRDALARQVSEEESIVHAMQQTLDRLQKVEPPLTPQSAQSALDASIQVEEKKLSLTEAQLSPLILTAPIDGQVTWVHRQAGENVAAGDAIVTISAARTDHVIAYLPEPLTVEPKVGMPVEIRTRNLSGQSGEGRILRVGVQMHTITNGLLRTAPTLQNGLPLLISLPAGFRARPGEIVDLSLGR